MTKYYYGIEFERIEGASIGASVTYDRYEGEAYICISLVFFAIVIGRLKKVMDD